MSVQEHISIWEFLDSGNFQSTENLNKLQSVLLDHKDDLMSAYGWEYEEWLDDLPEENEDDSYFRMQEQEEKDFETKLLTL